LSRSARAIARSIQELSVKFGVRQWLIPNGWIYFTSVKVLIHSSQLNLRRDYTFQSMNESMLATLGLGFVLGIKHATEADHLAAVSTIVSQRRSVWQSAAVGVFWGIGHTAALVAAGVLVLGVGLVIPEKIANIFELVVALMIIFLGMRLLHLHIHAHS